ncbi:helix-turn-helix domain-containing protein [Heyndrickxia coagulans]|uniref:helix-turn-helix domain-containing protein n=1 Tax=Heyndrickxia coagulans TaxID=1398 RepID=UPI00399057DD
MEEVKVDKWEMYMKIKQLKEQGFKIRRIARKLGISRTTVYKPKLRKCKIALDKIL